MLPFRRMAVRSCRMTCRDAQGVEHSAEVTAQTLYEAGRKFGGLSDIVSGTARRAAALGVRGPSEAAGGRTQSSNARLRELARCSAEELGRDGAKESFARDPQ
jgi:hypothetical protein